MCMCVWTTMANIASTVEPLNTGNEPFTTTDGYQWQRGIQLHFWCVQWALN